MMKDFRYIPAFHFYWLTRWYDPVMRHLFPAEAQKSALIVQASIQPGHDVLDIGCGTGTLTLQIKQTHSDASVYGLDVDPEISNITQRKAKQADKTILLQQGTATNLPYPNESFDRAFISLMLHHLPTQDKRQALAETFHVLKLGGELHVADFGKPHDPIMWLISLVVRWTEEVHDNILGLLPVFIADTGFYPVEETACYRKIFCSAVLYRACKPPKEVLKKVAYEG